MKLSVIIVNYNVRYFLEQCLRSVLNAAENIESEIIVVDNNSVDGSVAMLQKNFPQIKLIANKDNVGFSRANNQALKIAKGEYVLLLNPDTVVEADTFKKVIDFMDNHPDAGGLGVKMVDGKGRFLPESKRGLPTPSVAFFKIFGLSKLFPKSKTFGKYHLSYLDKNKIHSVEILAGAFMLLRKSVLDEIGYLDEAFFMYGEDIDLSYRIIKAGYKNYYFPETRIIHYKGESTKKSSVNYVFVFYNAMLIFARKHFTAQNALLFSFLIKIAIYFRASLSILSRFFQKIFLPLTDTLLILGGFYVITHYWELWVMHSESDYYPWEMLPLLFCGYALVLLSSVFFNGGYDRPIRVFKIFRGIVFGTLMLLVIYALLPENLRFSRAITLLGALWAAFSMIFYRFILTQFKFSNIDIGFARNKNFAIIGEEEEAKRVEALLKQAHSYSVNTVLISPDNQPVQSDIFSGNIEQLEDIVQIHKISEIIFCAKDIPANKIIDLMSSLQKTEVDFKIAPPDSLFIIGSNSIHSTGELYTIEVNSLAKKENARNKRMLDLGISFALLLWFPILIFFIKRPKGYFINIFKVISGKYSWVGIDSETLLQKPELTSTIKLKKGILSPLDNYRKRNINSETAIRIYMLYARDYHLINDISTLIISFREIGRKL